MFSFKFVFVFGVLAVSLRNVRTSELSLPASVDRWGFHWSFSSKVIPKKTVEFAVSSEDKHKIYAAMVPHIAACSSEFGVTEDDIKTAKETGKLGALDSCLMGCVFKKIEVINDQGLFDFDKAEELSKNLLSEDADQKKALEAITTCKAVNERDVTDGEKGCERAGFLLECFIPFKDTFIH